MNIIIFVLSITQNGLPNVVSVDGGAGLRGAEPGLLCGGEFHRERRLRPQESESTEHR